MEDQEVNLNEQQGQEQDLSWEFVDESEVAAAQQAEQQPIGEEVQQTETVEDSQPEYETSTEDTQTEYTQNYSEEDMDGAVLDYISERLGVDVNSLDDLFAEQQQQETVLDERLEAILDFVEDTGRSPEDWFIYQQLNPSEMDDVTAIQVQMANDYPNLSNEEIVTLMNNKYKLDSDLHSEEEVRVSQLQVKIDAQNARDAIEGIRSQYAAPEPQEYVEDDVPFDDDWYEAMQYETQALDGVEFDLGNGNSFTFGLNDQYRSELMDKNSRLDEYFDPYVQRDGSWDYDKLNVHRAVVDNMEQIVQAVYRQGMSDGQRGLVNQAANVGTPTPNQGGQPQESNLDKQLREALGGSNAWTFNL